MADGLDGVHLPFPGCQVRRDRTGESLVGKTGLRFSDADVLCFTGSFTGRMNLGGKES